MLLVPPKPGNETYIWEVKPDKTQYYSSGGIGDIQIQRYLDAGKDNEQIFSKPLVVGYNLGTATLPWVNGQYIHIRSFINPASDDDPRNGLVLYEVNTSPSPNPEAVPAVNLEVSYESDTEQAINTVVGVIVVVGVATIIGGGLYLLQRLEDQLFTFYRLR